MNLLEALKAWLSTIPDISWEQLQDLLDGDIDDPLTAAELRKIKEAYLDAVFMALKSAAPWLHVFAGGTLRRLYDQLIERWIESMIAKAKKSASFRK